MSAILDLGPPLVRPTDMRLRPYQAEAIDAIRREFSGGRKATLLILPTGCGKTVTFAAIARETAIRGGRTLVLAHRGELITQAVDTLARWGLEVGVEKAGSHGRALGDPHVVVATVQTMQGDRLARWPADYFQLLIVDEAHHATADTYRRVCRHFQAHHLGVTATAERADETFLGDVYESVAYDLSLWDAMKEGHLCRLRFVQCDVGIDLRQIRTTGGDLNQADLEEAIRPHIDTLANAIRQEIGERKTLVFTPDVGSATAMATALESINVPARWVSGDHPDRKGIVAAYKAGEFQALVNCNLLLEGFDCPDIAAIGLCRPTKSRPLYAQMVGRGTRPAKPDCLLVDFNWMTEKHQLVKPVELFDSTTQDSEVVEIAGRIIDSEPGVELIEAVERAKGEQQRRTVLRIQARERELRYRKVSYDPLAAMDILGVVARRESPSIQGTATDKQRGALVRFGLTDVDGLSKPAAGRLLDQLIARVQKKLATYKQVSWLIKEGVDPDSARAMSKDEAHEYLNRLWGRRERAS
jgi:superfamily II DNA or RNA helicase